MTIVDIEKAVPAIGPPRELAEAPRFDGVEVGALGRS